MIYRVEQEERNGTRWGGESTIDEERRALCQIAFNNVEWSPVRRPLELELPIIPASLTKVTTGEGSKGKETGIPPWLVGSVFMLVPAIFDIEYWAPPDKKIFAFWSNHDEESQVVHRRRQAFTYLEDCLQMVIQVEFEGAGVISYRSNLLAKGAWEEWRRAQGRPEHLSPHRIRQALVGEERPNWWQRMKSVFSRHPTPLPVTANVIQTTLTSVLPLGRYRGVSESHRRLYLHQTGLDRIQIVDPNTLQPNKQHQLFELLSYHDLQPKLFRGIPCPRPLIDPLTGELVNVLINYKGPGRWANYRVITISNRATTTLGGSTREASSHPLHDEEEEEETKLIAQFKARPTQLTTFAMSQYYVIIPISPLQHRHCIPDFATRRTKSTLISGMDDYLEFFPSEDTLFYVVGRQSRRLVAVYRSEAASIITAINAYEEENPLVMDVIATKVPEGPHPLTDLRNGDRFRGINGSISASSGRRVRRYVLPAFTEEMARFEGAGGQLKRFPVAPYHLLTDYEVWHPIMPSEIVSQPYRYVYVTAMDREQRGRSGFNLPNAIVKCDLRSPLRSIQWHRPGTVVSPPLFVPRSEGTMVSNTGAIVTSRAITEDDGLIVTLTLDYRSKQSFVTILDARDLRESGRYRLPQAIPLAASTPVWLPTLHMALSMVEMSPIAQPATLASSETTGVAKTSPPLGMAEIPTRHTIGGGIPLTAGIQPIGSPGTTISSSRSFKS